LAVVNQPTITNRRHCPLIRKWEKERYESWNGREEEEEEELLWLREVGENR